MLGKFFNENRSPVPYDSISPVFFQALIATEDERFYQHHGVDYQGIFAAAKDAARRIADELEGLVAKDAWPMPTYSDILFYI